MIDETDDDWMMHVMNTNLGEPMRYIRQALKIFIPKMMVLLSIFPL